MGSNPAGLILYNATNFSYAKKLNTLGPKKNSPKKLNYLLSFRSIIAPSSVSNIKLLLNKTKSNKVLVKQSYLLLTWFTYISNTNSGTHSYRPKFFIKPLKRSRFTIVKAPMAHKTFSQEQYSFQFYAISISFKFLLGSQNPTLNSSLYLAQSVRNSSTFFETNLFFFLK